MKKIAILGSTGSIGTQTLDIVREQGDIQVVAMAAGSNIKLLEAQMREFHPALVSVWDEKKASELRTNTKDLGIKIVSGMEGLLEVSVIPESEILVTAIVGMLGIRPTIAAIKARKKIALANKETLVTAGHIIIPLAKEYDVPILPVDSEHSAIFQSLQGGQHKALHKILLTASGGPFRGKKQEDLLNIQVEDAEVVLVAYGISSRVSREAVEIARAQGFKLGLIRPITLWPFPKKAFEEAKEAKAFLTVEMNILGQMVDDVKLATEGKYPVDHYGSIFEIPETDGIIAKAKEMLKKGEI